MCLTTIPAIVEGLHSERFKQFALDDARAAFLLPNCTCKHELLQPSNGESLYATFHIIRLTKFTHTCG